LAGATLACLFILFMVEFINHVQAIHNKPISKGNSDVLDLQNKKAPELAAWVLFET